MRYLEILIDRAREASGETRYSSDSGKSQKQFTQFFQNAQDFIVREIILSKSKYLTTRTIRSVVSGQEEYSYQSDAFMNNIDTIQWSTDRSSWGDALVRCIAKDQGISQNGYPFGYIPTQDGYILTPPISNGYLLESYSRRPKRLEKRSGLVVSTTGTPITSITLDASYTGHDPTYLNQFSSITVVDRNGRPIVASIPITSVSGTTITLPSYTLASGESISAGDYILAEGNTTNLPGYDDTFESFLILHATYQAQYGASSQWSEATLKDVSTHAKQIIDVLGTLSEDVVQVPIINTDFLSIW